MDYSINNSKISSYYDLPRLVQMDKTETFLKEVALYPTTMEMVNPQYIFGIEIEAENVQITRLTAQYHPLWDVVADNSLRNNGLEFVSIPLKSKYIEAALTQLNNNLNKDIEFTSRTSVHVHMNVRDLTISQIMNVILIYTALEDVLFNWIGHDRDKNIFCIKLTETNYVHNYLSLQQDPTIASRYWNKYTALNLAPMESKGTIEFRHMNGTANTSHIITWINLLSCIKNTAKRYTTEKLINTIMELNSCSLYEEFLRDVFGEYYDTVHPKAPLQKYMENAVSYIKLTQAAPPQEQPQQKPIDWNALHQDFATQQRLNIRQAPRVQGTNPTIQIIDDRIHVAYTRPGETARMDLEQPIQTDYLERLRQTLDVQF